MELLFTGLQKKSRCLIWRHAKFKTSIRQIRTDIKSAADTQIWSLVERPQLHIMSSWLVFKYKGKWKKSHRGGEGGGLETSPELGQQLEIDLMWPGYGHIFKNIQCVLKKMHALFLFCMYWLISVCLIYKFPDCV